MPWDPNRRSHPKYRSAEHRAYTAELKQQLRAQGYLICQAERCLARTRVITDPNGMHRDGLTAGHMPDGVTYNGPEHRVCNIHEAAVRANRRSRGVDVPRRWVV